MVTDPGTTIPITTSELFPVHMKYFLFSGFIVLSLGSPKSGRAGNSLGLSRPFVDLEAQRGEMSRLRSQS